MRVKQVCFFSVFVGVFVLCGISVAVPPTWTISGVVTTADGTGVEGVDVVPDGGIAPTITAADGSYSITVFNHWDGTVTVSKTGWLITPPSKSYTNVVENLTGQNYTAYQPKISGYVTKSDGTPLAGVTVATNNGGGTDTTDATGYYEFYVPYNWSGAVSATLVGYHFTDKSHANVITDLTNQDFSGYQPTISGSTNVVGVTVTVSGVGVITSTPDYTVTVPYGWSGTITAELTGYDFTNSPLSYTNVMTDLTNQDFLPFQPTISGAITKDGGVSFAGVTISANNGGGTGVTDANGDYEIIVPYNWSGTTTAIKADWGFYESPRSYQGITNDLTEQNYTAFQPLISGYIQTQQGNPIESVLVTISNGLGITSTSIDGYFEIVVPYNCSSVLSVYKEGWAFSPSSVPFANIRADFNNNFQGVVSANIGKYSGGDGTTADPYRIWDCNDIIELSQTSSDWDSHFVLLNDIDCNSIGTQDFSCIGNSNNPFTGIFEGNGFSIQNFILINPAGTRIGFFGYISGENAEVRNLKFENVHIETTSTSFVGLGIVAGQCYKGSISNCDVISGYVAGPEIDMSYGLTNSVGGVAGVNGTGVVSNCYADCEVRGSEFVGGVIGSNSGHITMCSSSGLVTGLGSIGGCVGRNFGSIENSCSLSEVIVIYTKYGAGGGFVGGSEYRIRNCYSSGKVSGSNTGGFAGGVNKALVENCFWDIESSGKANALISDYPGLIQGKTTDEMMRKDTFENADWNFTLPVWTIEEEQTYPLPVNSHQLVPQSYAIKGLGIAKELSQTGEFNEYYVFVEFSDESFFEVRYRTDFTISHPEYASVSNSGVLSTNHVSDITEITLTASSLIKGINLEDAVNILIYPCFSTSTCYYVDQNATGNSTGMDWENAFNSIHPANYLSVSGDEIRVAKGTYKPCHSYHMPYETIDMNRSFRFDNHVLIKGGYAGSTSEFPNERNIEGYKTILSGDLLENDGVLISHELLTNENRFDNSSTVVSGPCNLDGFYIIGGNDRQGAGGGVYIGYNSGDSEIRNCRIINCSAKTSGGGIYYAYGTHVLEKCKIINNYADSGYIAFEGGGGVYIDDLADMVTIKDCYFSNNAVPERLLEPFPFAYGAGLRTHNFIQLIDCVFESHDQVAVLVDSYHGSWISDCYFNNNEVGILNYQNMFVKNSIFSNNVESGIYNYDTSHDLFIENCTFYRNGNGVRNRSVTYSVDVASCIFWASQNQDLKALMGAGFTIYSSSFAEDPQFADVNNLDFHLKSEYGRWDPNNSVWVFDNTTSPCVDTGYLYDSDWQNELWPHGGRINMGAYGGTPQASMSPNDIGNPADLNHDDFVDLADWSLWADDWLAQRVLLDSDFDRNNSVDANDMTVFMENWLWGQ